MNIFLSKTKKILSCTILIFNNMKKILFLGILTCGFLLISCGSKASPKSVAEKMCAMGEKMLKAESEGNENEAKKMEDEMDNYSKEMKDRYKDDEKFLDSVTDLVKTCRKELEAKYEKKDMD